MVVVAQLAEHWIVVPGVAGSNPVFHPTEGAVSKMNFDAAPFRFVRMRKVQGTKTETQGIVLNYAYEAECRKQRGNLSMMTNRIFILSWYTSKQLCFETLPKKPA